MLRFWRIVTDLFFIALVVLGSVVILVGLLKINEMPRDIVSIKNSYYFYQNEFGTIFYIKAETVGAFMANNPINFSITTNGLDVRGIQLEFLGASQYFPNRTRPILPILPPNPSMEDWQQYENEMDGYRAEIEKQNDDLRNLIGANILFLRNDTNLYVIFPSENVTFQNYPTFSGFMQNLSYPVGGKYSIGVTVTLSDGGVVGYGLGNTAYVLNDVIEVAPLETKFQIQNNSIMVGLGWIGIGIALFLAGIALIVEFKPFKKIDREKATPKIVLEFALSDSD